MKYSKKIITSAAETLRMRRLNAESEASQRKSDFITEHPELAEIESHMAQTGLDAVKAILGCSDPKKYIDKLKKSNLDYQKARKAILQSAGITEASLLPNYTCPICKDTGYVDGKICKCHSELLRLLAFKELADCTPLKLSSFDDFDVSLYNTPEARKKMTTIFKFCKEYAEDFSTESGSLFFYGETGLGKTHLSLAIAGQAVKKGFGVVYGSAQNLLTMIERERFGRSDEPDGTTEERLLCCDLLILDDLGAEFSTQFTIAELYNIINTRMAKELPTIINSNIPLEELEKKYGSRITSRIIGTYTMLKFIGNDIRQK